MNIRTRFGHPPNPNPLKRNPIINKSSKIKPARPILRYKSSKIKPARPILRYFNPLSQIYNSLLNLKNNKGK